MAANSERWSMDHWEDRVSDRWLNVVVAPLALAKGRSVGIRIVVALVYFVWAVFLLPVTAAVFLACILTWFIRDIGYNERSEEWNDD